MVAAHRFTSGVASSLLTTLLVGALGQSTVAAVDDPVGQDPVVTPASAEGPADCMTRRLVDVAHARVRTMDGPARRLLARAMEQSCVVATMVDVIDRSDVLVYIETRPLLSLADGFVVRTGAATRARFVRLRGYVQVAGATPAVRYLRLVIGTPDSESALMAVLGHELRHVLEIVGMPDVRDQQSLVERYREIGVPMARGGYYETAAALATERQVARELAVASRSHRARATTDAAALPVNATRGATAIVR